MTLKLFFLLSVFSTVNAYILKGEEVLDEHFEKRFAYFRARHNNGKSTRWWGKKTLTYAVDRAHFPDVMTQKDMYDGLEEAFNLWESVDMCGGSLTFIDIGSENFDQADIKIGFYKGNHGVPGLNFYGAGGEKGHAFAPGNLSYSGQIHFNGYEQWHYFREGDSRDDRGKVNFAYCAAHEIGHAIGLDHSKDENSFMRTYYPGNSYDPWLTRDDVEGLRNLFSPKGKCCTEEDPPRCVGSTNIQDCCNTIGWVFSIPKTISEERKIIFCEEYHDIYPSNCPSGYYSGGIGICQDIDECHAGLAKKDICKRLKKTCKNTLGSYLCE